ncbi:MAG: pseudaminic acid cytidylyltransferase [Erythrobacter sp.]|uniref:pseudaminic acid cytidylyltransferase n=1 Tax=Erythrobacter sp. TaxID=1042 RepID=UPI00260D957B|nr:pseudaminic acid cytidylyltransferase [Erythrobacter sp.]MDJ0978396.1 pseudaminic acid cytidylyltransferase [Erythrobacter sp.]
MSATGNIAIIPARGGSKRIPRKNIRPFAGKPMIGYAIEAALCSPVIERVLVTTDDTAIADIARDLGAEVPFTRPRDLADDHTPTVPVIQHAITAARDAGWDVRRAVCVYPGVPFIEVDDLARALELLLAHQEQGYTFPVAEFPSAIQRALRRDSEGGVAPFYPEHAETRTQDLEPAFYDAGQFYWGSAATWLSGVNIHRNGCAITLPSWRVVDIDTPEDWDRAEKMHTALMAKAR